MEKNAASDRLEGPFILIVDDEIPLAEMLAGVVIDLGYSPKIAYNGRQALALVRESWPILVITDQMMPLMNGVDLIRALSTEATVRKTKPPPVVLLSGIEAIDLKGVHVDARIKKPFDFEELEAVIERLYGETSS
jgi:two-component system, chemotaxis family, chemotaxis protein CheY